MGLTMEPTPLSSADLAAFRERLDRIDRTILDALAERRALVGEILEVKDREGLLLRDLAREGAMRRALVEEGKARGLDAHFVSRLFGEVIADSVRLQADLLVRRQNASRQGAGPFVVAYAGTAGSYAELAARRHFAGEAERAVLRGYRTFREAATAVERREAAYGVLPIENTTAGSINDTYDVLTETGLSIVGEVVLHVDHCLVGVAEVPLARVARVLSHPHALAQCSGFLEAMPHVTPEPFHNTALAARKVKDDGDPTQAAIASREAAEQYGLHILKEGIADRPFNFTRFVVVAGAPIQLDARIACRTSLVFATKHEEGALARTLAVLAKHHLNLTKLESRPRPNVPWEYNFYADFEGNVADPGVRAALEELTTIVSYLKVFGSYPAATGVGARAPEAPELAGAGVAEPGSAPGNGRSQGLPLPPGEGRGEGGHDRRVTPSLEGPYRLASLAHRPEPTRVRVGDLLVGGGGLVIMAGPCSVESREQIFAAARAVRDAGGHILRGGCFKPRTSPYSFQGLGYEGLELLAEAGRAFGLPIVTEVLAEVDVGRVGREADILQIGARNMQNFALLREVGKVDRPILLKRGMMSSIEELLAAAEYILSQGNQQVILCERGIRTFETATRNTLDISAVPALRERTHLPVIVDPSHGCGRASLVPPLARAAAAVGADGIMIEMHPRPEEALSDADQAITPTVLADVLRSIASIRR